MDDELYEKGIAIREEMLGPEHGRAKVAEPGLAEPALAEPGQQ